PRFAASPDEHARILVAFMNSVLAGDEVALTELLAEDASLWTDAGGKVRGGARRPLHGRERVLRALLSFAKRDAGRADLSMDVGLLNGWPAIVVRSGGRVGAVIHIETNGKQIIAVRSVANPDKLALPSVN